MNRARRKDEDYGDYRADLKKEATVMKFRLRGRWVWKTFYPIDVDTKDLPRNAVIYHRDQETGIMVQSKIRKHHERMEYIKFPPYRAPEDSKRKTFSEQRNIIARVLENANAANQSSEAGTPQEDHA